MSGKDYFQRLGKGRLKIMMFIIFVTIMILSTIVFYKIYQPINYDIPLYLEKSPEEIKSILGKPVSVGSSVGRFYLTYDKDLLSLYLILNSSDHVSEALFCSKDTEIYYQELLIIGNLKPSKEYVYFELADNCVMVKSK